MYWNKFESCGNAIVKIVAIDVETTNSRIKKTTRFLNTKLCFRFLLHFRNKYPFFNIHFLYLQIEIVAKGFAYFERVCCISDNVALFIYNNKKFRYTKGERIANGYKFCLRLPKTGYRLKSLLLALLFSYSAELIGLSSWN